MRLKKIIYVLLALFILTGCEKVEENEKNETKDQEVSYAESNITYEQLEEYFDQFECGDIINLAHTHYLSNLAIPGKWKHTLIYLGSQEQVKAKIHEDSQYYQKIMDQYKTGDEIFVLDANSTGVKIRPFSAMANLDEESYLKALICYRFKKDDMFIQSFIENAMSYYGTPYDYEMNSFDDGALYCSELVYYALLKSQIELTSFTKILEYEVLTPSDLVQELEDRDLAEKIMLLENSEEM